MPELAPPVEVGVGAPAPANQVLWHRAQKLDEEGQVVLIAWVFVRSLGVKEVVTGSKLENHASQRPDVCGGVIACIDDGLR